MPLLPADDPDARQDLHNREPHQNTRDKILHVGPAGRSRHGAAGNAEDDEGHAAENALLPLQFLRAVKQIEDLRIVIDAHAVLRRVLAVHQLRKRHMERIAELLDNAVIRHAFAPFTYLKILVFQSIFPTNL